jgi:hypothetical protein
MNSPEILIDGIIHNRIPFGAEPDDDGEEQCPDCGVKRGELHKSGCDQERCPKCGGQLISCDCVGRAVGADDGEKPQEPDYDLPRSLDSSEVGRRLSYVAELLKFADAGLGATQQGNHGAQLVIKEALREVQTITESNVKVMEELIPF